MKKVLLKIYTEYNLGDDLFIKMVCERYANHKFYIISDEKYSSFTKNWNNLNIIDINVYNTSTSILGRVWNKFLRNLFPKIFNKRVFRNYKKQLDKTGIEFDMFLAIGGSIFMQKTENVLLDYDIIFYNFILDKFIDKKKIILGSNFGPSFTDSYNTEYSSIFNAFDDVCFRELKSYEMFKSSQKVRFSTDIVFGLNVEINNKIRGTIGFTITSARGLLSDEEYVRKYSEIIEYYQKQNLDLYLISFCKCEGDEDVINKILSKIESHHNIHKLFYRGNIEEFLTSYSQIEHMYCGRFHSLILSLLYKQYIIPVAYSNKMINILNDIGYDGQIVNLSEIKNYDPNESGFPNIIDVENLKLESLKQFEVLDKYLQ